MGTLLMKELGVRKARSSVMCVMVAACAAALPSPASAAWLTPAARTAVAAHPEKTPAAFTSWTRYALPDGTLRVIVALDRRDAGSESWAAGATAWHAFYGKSPRMLARVDTGQLVSLLGAKNVRFVEPDHPYAYALSTSAIDVRARGAMWSFDAAGGPLGALRSEVPGFGVDGVTGKGVTVAITDSGIDGTHRDFGGFDCAASAYTPCESRIKRKVVVDQIAGAGFDVNPPTSDLASGHGTHVAGIIGGNGYTARDGDAHPDVFGGDGVPIGIAPESSLINVKNGDSQWAGLWLFALQWELDHAAEYGIRVSNNSLGCVGGCAFDPASAEAGTFRDLYHAGVLVVFAAGNDGGGADGAAFNGDGQSPYVLSVANYDHHNGQLSSSSSRGASSAALGDPATYDPDTAPAAGDRRPDLAAPGESVWSTHNLTGGSTVLTPRVNSNDVTGGASNGFYPYVQVSGTSMSAPHVTGAAADLFSACPAATVRDVMRALMASADPRIQRTGGGGVAAGWEQGYGALNVRGALDALRAATGC